MITPGPWRVGYWHGQCHKSHGGNSRHPGPDAPDGCVYDYEFSDGGSFGIAGPQPQQMVVTTSYDELLISPDDARLIATAPEMAELLRREPSEGHTYKWQQERKAALAKAGVEA
jgi:hypothetical protein